VVITAACLPAAGKRGSEASMREVVFDTETTGFGVEEHRVIELGAVEFINRLPTGKPFHV